MPSAIRHDQEFSGKGLVTILVESQGSDQQSLESFLWKTFPDNECFTCTGTFVPLPESRGIPHAGIIGVDGTLLWAGNPLSATQHIDELLDAELAKVKKGWGDTSDARKVRAALYGKGDIAAAQSVVSGLPEGEERTALQAEIDKRYGVMKKAVAALKEQGRWLDAQDAAEGLAKAVGGNDQRSAEADALVAEFATDVAKAEIALDKKLDKVEKQLRNKKRDSATRALQSLLKNAGSTVVAERARALLAALESKV